MEHVKLATLLAIAVIIIAIVVISHTKDEDTSDTSEGTSSKTATVSARAAWHAPGLKFLSPDGSDIVVRDVTSDILSRGFKYSQHLNGEMKKKVDSAFENVKTRLIPQTEKKARDYAKGYTDKYVADQLDRVYIDLGRRVQRLEEKIDNKIDRGSMVRLRNKAKADAFQRSEPQTSLASYLGVSAGNWREVHMTSTWHDKTAEFYIG